MCWKKRACKKALGRGDIIAKPPRFDKLKRANFSLIYVFVLFYYIPVVV
jgi:hypothetical protein